MKNKLLIVLALAGCVSLSVTGCTHEHVWMEATCTEPATCQECGETKGKPLGHEWTEATCEEPKTCTVCGETDGEPLGHDWIPATHENPETCARCGKTQGEPLLYDIPPGLTEGYQFGEFETFNSHATENGLGGTMIWINGSYDSVFTFDLPNVGQGVQAYLATFTDESEHTWLIFLDLNQFEQIDRYAELTNHQLCVTGRYEGFSDVYEMPTMHVEMIFDQTTGNTIYPVWYSVTY